MERTRHRDWGTILLVLVALAGVGLLLYPTLSDLWNQHHQTQAITSYVEATSALSERQKAEQLRAAETYNERFTRMGMQWEADNLQRAEYEAQLNTNEAGVIGYLNVPKINLMLPIYRGTNESATRVAATHLLGTSLPVGGEGTHSCITGHRGLPSARLFTDLDKLEVGDTWTVTVLDRTITYEADQIRIVEPTELETLRLDPAADLCTLITCTPYGVNSHRLLVRGHRVRNLPDEAIVLAEAVRIDARYVALAIAVPVLVVLFIIALVRPVARGNEAKEPEEP